MVKTVWIKENEKEYDVCELKESFESALFPSNTADTVYQAKSKPFGVSIKAG
jgi:hypothetical protein